MADHKGYFYHTYLLSIPLRIWRGLSSLAKRLSFSHWGLGLKLSFIISLLIFFVASLISFQVIRQERSALENELKKRGVNIVENLSKLSSDMVAERDLWGLYKLVRNIAQTYVSKGPWENELVYAIVIDDDGKLLAHSNPKNYQIGTSFNLTDVDVRAFRTDRLLIQSTRYDNKPIYDIALPIYSSKDKRRIGVARIGISRVYLEEALKGIRNEVLLTSFILALLGAIIGLIIAEKLTNPLKRLTNAAIEISNGRWRSIIGISPRAGDEFTQLSQAFNTMTFKLKEKIKEIEDTKSYLESLLENANDFIYTIDREGRITYVNRKFEALGYKRSEILGRQLMDIVEGELSCYLSNDQLSSYIASGDLKRGNREGCTRPVEVKIKGKDGRYREILMSMTPLFDRNKRLTGVLGIGCDITEKKRLEDQLFKAEKLASLGTFAAGLAHEIRNPLGSVITATRLMYSREGCLNRDSECKTLIDVINKESRRLDKILTDFLYFARPREPRMERVDVNGLLRDIVDLIRLDKCISRRVSFNTDFDLDVSYAYIDSDLIKQVFWNIILNSIEALDGREDGSIEVRTRSEGGGIRIEVADNGAGIGKEELCRVFEPFYTKKSTGTGLGLAIANRVIELHQGTIEIESELGIGTVCRITLPVEQTMVERAYRDREEEALSLEATHGG